MEMLCWIRLQFNVFAGVLMCVAAVAMSGFLAGLFVGYDAELKEMTQRGFAIYSLSFMVMGLNIYGSSFFTALNNGVISAMISFLRTLVFQMIAVLTLPAVWGLDGIWFSIVAAELMALVVTIGLLIGNRKKYGY